MNLRTLFAVPALCLAASLVPDAAALLRFDPPWVSSEDRACARAVYFSRTGVGGSYAIDYGRPEWKAEYDSTFDDLTLGKRVRLGQNHWTNLDATCPMRFGDGKEKEVKPGHYYLALERDKRGDWSLVLMDSDDLRKKRVDAFQTSTTSGGIEVPLHHEESQEVARTLTISMDPVDDDEFAQVLTIRFGPHVLSTRVKGKV